MKVDDHQYADEFMAEVTVVEFGEWIFSNLRGFVVNLSRQSNKVKPKSLHEWIGLFLDWSEYNDFMSWKDFVEKSDE